MKKQPDRRKVLKCAAAACAALFLPRREEAAESALRVAGQDVEIQIAPVSEYTVRLTVLPAKRASEDGQSVAVTGDGSLVQSSCGPPLATLRGLTFPRTVKAGNLRVKVSADPIAFTIASEKGATIQQRKFSRSAGRSLWTSRDKMVLF